jgi:hypothetical protein
MKGINRRRKGLGDNNKREKYFFFQQSEQNRWERPTLSKACTTAVSPLYCCPELNETFYNCTARVFSCDSPGKVAQWTGRPIRES